jgi:hypothetical protein
MLSPGKHKLLQVMTLNTPQLLPAFDHAKNLTLAVRKL